MSKKRGKSGVGSATGVARWEQAILQTALTDDKWNANITFLVSNKPEDKNYIDALASVINVPTRRLFSIITQVDLFNQVKELGNPKGKKPKEVPQNYEICESCKLHLDNDEDIPLPLLAKLLKFRLLNIKSNDLKRRDAEKKVNFLNICLRVIQCLYNSKGLEAALEKDKPGKKGDKRDRSKSPKKGGGKKTPDPPAPKKESKLRKRGEEDLDNKYIDDEPDDGPEHYILVQGFNHPHLISYLSEIGINVDCIIKLKSQDYSRFETETADVDPDIDQVEKDEKTLATEEEAYQEKLREQKELDIFWRDVLPLLQKAPQTSKLHDVARLEYEVKSLIIPENMDDNDQKVEFGTNLFEDIAVMIYDLLDAKRQYQNYLDNIKLINIPLLGAAHPPPATDALSGTASAMERQTEKMPSSQEMVAPGTPEVDMRYYNELLSTVPLESVSVPLILNCMLEQVTATAEDKLLPSETIPAVQPDGLSQELATHLSSMAFKLGLSEDERKLLEAEIPVSEPKPEPPNQPLLMSPHDNISQRLNHLKTVHGFNPKEAETQMLHYLPYFGLNSFPRPVSRIAKERASRLQELLYFCTTDGLSPSEIDRAFKQFVFECMDVTSTDPNGFIVTKSGEGAHENAIPWDDPYPFFKGMIPKKEKRELDLEIQDSAATSVSSLRSGARTPEQNKAEQGSRSPGPSILKSRSPSPKNRTKSPASGSTSPLKSSSADTITETEEEISIHQIDLSKIDSSIPMDDNLSGTLHSVRFGTDPEGNVIEPLPSSPEPEKTIDEGMDEVVDAQMRNLDQWCFAEHYEPHILLQVLEKAAYTLPYVDTYYHKRDHTLMVILHNPHSLELQSFVDWEENLHSNVGFRNYLEHVAESVAEWTKGEEAKHMATQLVKELEQIQKDEEAASRPTSASKKKDRSKSPKKSPRGRSSSRSSSQERSSTPSDPFIRQNSLKSWKAEQDAIRQEEEEKERQKLEKRAKSAQKKASREEVEKEKDDKKKRPGSRGSAKSRKSSKPDLEKPAEEPQTDTEKEPEEFWPFTGYDVGNDLIHSSGSVSTLFPSDGGIIRTERIDYIQGSSYVRSTVVKDGHVFNVHIIDPKDITDDAEAAENNIKLSPESMNSVDKNLKIDDEEEKADIEKSEKSVQNGDSADTAAAAAAVAADKKSRVGLFGSFTAQMADGVVFGFSAYGDSGIPSGDSWPITAEDSGQDSRDTLESKQEPEQYTPPPVRSPTPVTKESPSKNKREKSRERDKTPEPSSVPVVETEEPLKVIFDLEEEVVPTPFQQMFITCPDGLQIKYNLESAYGIRPSNAGEQIHVRQCYPVKSLGIHDCEADRKVPAMIESSRVITPDGIVVKAMMDGTFQVLHADGTVNYLKGFPAAMQTASRTSSPMRGGSAKSQSQQEKPESPRKGTKISYTDCRGGSRKPSANEEKKEPEEEKDPGEWITTLPSGERICTKPGDTELLEVKDVLLSVATDPESKQIFMSRADQVMICQQPDGSTVVEHEDKTRITVYIKPVQVISEPPKDENSDGEPILETIMVKYVKVECPGFATVEFDMETGECMTTLASSSIINVQVDGSYNIDYCDGSKVEVDPEGAVVFKPKPNNNLEFATMSEDLMYFMRHHSELICETMDNEGNVFSVKHNGEVIVLMNNGEEDNGSLSSGESIEVKNAEKKIHYYKQHAPRFFIIHSNGSGTELLRYEDVAEFVACSEEDPNAAVIIEPLPDYPGVTGVTIMKPHQTNISQKWLKPYDEATIIPPGLRSRDLKTIPAKEYKKDGPEFGTELGRGLAIGSAKKIPPLPPQPKCPQVLELRQLVQYNAMTSDMRNVLCTGLQEYAEHVKARTISIQNMAIEDPCSEEEKIHASDLISQVITQKVIRDGLSQVYEQATAPPVPSPPPTPQPKRSKADWERDQRELAEEMENRAALRNHAVPPYFKSELGKAYILSQAPNMESILKELEEDPRQDEDAAIRSEHSTFSPPQPAAGNSPNKLRPGNPTPSHANGQGSPQGVRPTNPTPAHGLTNTSADRPGNPTPHRVYSVNESQSSHYPIIAEHPEEVYEIEEVRKSTPAGIQTDVLGQPRKNPIPLPPYIHAGRPRAQPNNKFMDVEDNVRRQVMTSSIAGATEIGKKLMAGLRGFALLPTRVNFGTLREGYTYHYNVHLKNVGIDACRFKIRQPPPSTGLRVIFNPGLVAAGMKAKLTLEIYAIAVGVEGEFGTGSIMHDLEITTETEILTLPIRAIVMTANECDNEQPSALAKGVRLASINPPDTQGIIRPRKELKIAA
ncbi:sperm-associated antigen 17-like [Tubulanus polymorphus]|uniref:sperm-associated antigen 17-like n=1 Tax=Tubulanus polymorphus TaxID=672921 RepID=UPI003DA27E23